MLFEKKIEKKTKIIVNPVKYVYIDNEPIKPTEIIKEVVKEVKTPISSQFSEGNIKLVYTRLNGAKETFMVDKNAKLHNNFTVQEFLSPDSNELLLDEYLITILQMVRYHFGSSVNITSGYRTKAFNDTLIGADPNSKHLLGRAADFNVNGVNKNDVLKYVQTIPMVAHAYTNETNMLNAVHINI